MFAALTLAGCVTADDPSVSALEVTTINFVSDSTVTNTETCRVHNSRLADWPAGSQLLIYRGTRLRGMCTVVADSATSPTVTSADQIRAHLTLLNERVRQSPEAVNTASITGVTVRNEATSGSGAPVIVTAATTTAQLETVDNTARELAQIPAAPTGVSVAYTVPHPWENDQNVTSSGCGTDCGFGRSYLAWRSAFQNQDAVNDGFWAVGMRGNRVEYSTFEASLTNTKRFHITSTQISPDSFPGLDDLEDAQFDYAVSFHGQGADAPCKTGMMVGGLIGSGGVGDAMAWRRGIAENIRTLVDPADPVIDCQSGGGSNCYGPLVPDSVRYTTGACTSFDVGMGPTNFVNELADQGGLQLEMGRDLDQAIYKRVGAAVHEVFDCLNEGPNVDVGPTSTWFARQDSVGNAYATAGHCHGFVVDANFAQDSDAFYAGAQTCTVGTKVHLDVYRQNAAGAWDRVAGGTRTYTSCSPQTFTDDAYDDGPAVSPSFQHNLPAGTAAGQYRVVVHGYTGTHFNATNAVAVWVQAS